jgi:hypothetical protein
MLDHKHKLVKELSTCWSIVWIFRLPENKQGQNDTQGAAMDAGTSGGECYMCTRPQCKNGYLIGV